MRRRTFIVASAAGIVGSAGCLGSEDPPAEPEPEDWFDGVDNYDGFEDYTGQSDVTVMNGTGENGFEFDPPAITVSPDTTVVWEWTGEGGDHNVEDPDRDWSSPYEDEEGFTWDRTFSEPGTHRYQCNPHRGVGMKGAIFVDADADE